jgi:hypothetical protein
MLRFRRMRCSQSSHSSMRPSAINLTRSLCALHAITTMPTAPLIVSDGAVFLQPDTQVGLEKQKRVCMCLTAPRRALEMWPFLEQSGLRELQ